MRSCLAAGQARCRDAWDSHDAGRVVQGEGGGSFRAQSHAGRSRRAIPGSCSCRVLTARARSVALHALTLLCRQTFDCNQDYEFLGDQKGHRALLDPLRDYMPNVVRLFITYRDSNRSECASRAGHAVVGRSSNLSLVMWTWCVVGAVGVGTGLWICRSILTAAHVLAPLGTYREPSSEPVRPFVRSFRCCDVSFLPSDCASQGPLLPVERILFTPALTAQYHKVSPRSLLAAQPDLQGTEDLRQCEPPRTHVTVSDGRQLECTTPFGASRCAVRCSVLLSDNVRGRCEQTWLCCARMRPRLCPSAACGSLASTPPRTLPARSWATLSTYWSATTRATIPRSVRTSCCVCCCSKSILASSQAARTLRSFP